METVYCPICVTAGTVEPWRVIRGVQWYICTACLSKFRNPIIIPAKAENPEE